MVTVYNVTIEMLYTYHLQCVDTFLLSMADPTQLCSTVTVLTAYISKTKKGKKLKIIWGDAHVMLSLFNISKWSTECSDQ